MECGLSASRSRRRRAAPFWEGTARGELLVQTCAACGQRRMPPRPMCPYCRSTDTTWEPLSGRGDDLVVRRAASAAAAGVRRARAVQRDHRRARRGPAPALRRQPRRVAPTVPSTRSTRRRSASGSRCRWCSPSSTTSRFPLGPSLSARPTKGADRSARAFAHHVRLLEDFARYLPVMPRVNEGSRPVRADLGSGSPTGSGRTTDGFAFLTTPLAERALPMELTCEPGSDLLSTSRRCPADVTRPDHRQTDA